MKKIKDVQQAKLLLESTREMLKKEMELYNKCSDPEIKELYLENIIKFKKTVAELEGALGINYCGCGEKLVFEEHVSILDKYDGKILVCNKYYCPKCFDEYEINEEQYDKEN